MGMLVRLIGTSLALLGLSFMGHCTYYNQQQHGDINYQIDLQDVLVVALVDDLGGDYNYEYDYSDLTVKPEPVETPFPTSTVSPLPEKPTTPHEQNTTHIEDTLIPPSLNSTHEEDTLIPPSQNSTHGEDSLTINQTHFHLHISSNATEEISTTEGVHVSPSNASDISTTTVKTVKEPEHPLNTHNYQIPVMIITEATKLKKGYVSSSSIRRKNPEHPVMDTDVLPKRTCSHGFFLDEKNRCKKINRKHTHSRSRPPLPYGLRYAQRPTHKPASDEISA